MKGVRGLALAAFLAFASGLGLSASDAAAPGPAGGRAVVPVRRVTSPGGISAWVVSDATVPMIVLDAYWKGGAAGDPKGLEGATSTMTEMLTEGAGSLDSNAFKVRLEELNMSLAFAAGWDGVSMSVTTLTKNRDAAFGLAETALTAPRFDAEPLARIKRQAAVAIKERESDPNFLANRALNTAMIPGHPYGNEISLAAVNAMDKAAISARRAAILARDNLEITVVGDVDDKTLTALLDKTFGALPAHGSAGAAPDANPKPGPALIVKSLPQPQSVILFQAPGIAIKDRDYIPLVVANYILGGGDLASRLMQVVREKEGLVYGIATGPRELDHAAFIRGSAQTKNASVQKAIDLTKAVIKHFYDEGASAQEVADAKTYLTGSFALELDGDEKIASVLQSYQTSGRTMEYVNQRNALIQAVTVEDVNRAIKRVFDPDKFVFVVVGQPRGLAPTP